MQSVFEKCGTKDVYCLPPRTWLHDIWAVGLVVDCEHIRDTNGIPACFAFLCGVACRHRLEKKKACKRSHDLSEQVVMEFRNLHEEKLRKAGALALERREKEAAKIPATRPLEPVPVPDWLLPHRQELIGRYDVSKYGLREKAEALLECGTETPGAGGLDQLHSDASFAWQSRMLRTGIAKVPLNPKLMHAYKHGGRKMPGMWKKALMRESKLFRDLKKDARWISFLEGVEDFCREELLPLCCGDVERQKEGMVVQFPPTLRIHMPGRSPSIAIHVDTDYSGHQECECNFWVPLTRVFGNNTLWSESAPHRNDFRPFELEEGEFVRFEGVKCRHFTKANTTNVTRVSFDLRAIPAGLWRDLYGGKIGDYGVKLILPKDHLREDDLREDVVRGGVSDGAGAPRSGTG